MKNSYGQKIAYYRRLSGLTQKELGAKIGIGSKGISSWEVGRTEPSMEMVTKLTQVLNCSVSDLMDSPISSLENEELVRLLQSYQSADETTRAIVRKILNI